MFLVPAGGSVVTVTPVATSGRSLLLSFTAWPSVRYDVFVLARNACGEGLAGRGSAGP